MMFCQKVHGGKQQQLQKGTDYPIIVSVCSTRWCTGIGLQITQGCCCSEIYTLAPSSGQRRETSVRLSGYTACVGKVMGWELFTIHPQYKWLVSIRWYTVGYTVLAGQKILQLRCIIVKKIYEALIKKVDFSVIARKSRAVIANISPLRLAAQAISKEKLNWFLISIIVDHFLVSGQHGVYSTKHNNTVICGSLSAWLTQKLLGDPNTSTWHLDRERSRDVFVDPDPDPPSQASQHRQDGREYGTKVREETKTLGDLYVPRMQES